MNALTSEKRSIFDYLWIALLFLILIYFLSGCTTYEKCMDKYATTVNDTTFHTFYDTARVTVKVAMPDDQVGGVIDINILDQDSLIYESQEGRAKATFWKDQYNSIRFKAECLPDTVKVEVPVPYEVKVPIAVRTAKFVAPPIKELKQNSLIERIAMNIGTVVLSFVFVLALWFGGKWVLEKYFPALKILSWLKKLKW